MIAAHNGNNPNSFFYSQKSLQAPPSTIWKMHSFQKKQSQKAWPLQLFSEVIPESHLLSHADHLRKLGFVSVSKQHGGGW